MLGIPDIPIAYSLTNRRIVLNIVREFKPDIIGISVMTFYKDFVHRAINYIREHGIETPIFLGGPYPTGDYKQVLQDQNLEDEQPGADSLTPFEPADDINKEDLDDLPF